MKKYAKTQIGHGRNLILIEADEADALDEYLERRGRGRQDKSRPIDLDDTSSPLIEILYSHGGVPL